MNKNSLEIYYDKEADILEIIIGEPSPCLFDEVDDDLFEAHDENTNELKGFKIFNFKKRVQSNKLRIPLPAEVSIITSNI